MTPADVGLLRLVAQRLAGPPEATPADAVRRLTAVQAQDLPGALLSVALRTASRSRAEVTAALDGGAVVRSWPMRGTLHLVAADDLPWLLELLAPRMVAGAARRRAQLGLTDGDVDRAREAATGALCGGRRLRRTDLLAELADAGVDVSGQRGYHLLGLLCQTGTLCLGPLEGRQQLVVLLDEWVGPVRRLPREAALGELALRFFRGHGPATVEDLARWAGLTRGDARAGLAGVRAQLASLDVDGREHLVDPATVDRLGACRDPAAGPHLLPGFDEFVLGYADRSAVLDPRFAGRIVPGGNGMFRATVVLGGRVVGTWARGGQRRDGSVTVEPFTPLPAGVDDAVRKVAGALP